jgi:ubiquinol-cytochrome c reductase cytochrome c1 subunit
MVRLFGVGAGVVFCLALVFALIFTPRSSEPNAAHAFHLEARSANLPSSGPFGHYDRAQLQRGLKVYKEVCAACHGLSLVAFRDLEALGYSEDQVKALAGQFQVPSLNPDTGEPTTRPGTPPDHFPSPYANDIAARAANNNALPPDLSLIVKAREGHDNYIYSLLTGFRNPPANLPAELRPAAGLHYNPYFANLNLAMPPPLTSTGQVTYDDGTPATVDQMSRDVTAFLVWAAEPKLENRLKTGWAVLGFLLVLTVLAYMSYRSIWAEKKGH